jgi:hypothetical protein
MNADYKERKQVAGIDDLTSFLLPYVFLIGGICEICGSKGENGRSSDDEDDDEDENENDFPDTCLTNSRL